MVTLVFHQGLACDQASAASAFVSEIIVVIAPWNEHGNPGSSCAAGETESRIHLRLAAARTADLGLSFPFRMR